jgi:hypothetical protein
LGNPNHVRPATLPELRFEGFRLSADLVSDGDLLGVEGRGTSARAIAVGWASLIWLAATLVAREASCQTAVGYGPALLGLGLAVLGRLVAHLTRIRIDFDRASRTVTVERDFLSVWSRGVSFPFAAIEKLDVTIVPAVPGCCLVLSAPGGRRALLGHFDRQSDMVGDIKGPLTALVFQRPVSG